MRILISLLILVRCSALNAQEEVLIPFQKIPGGPFGYVTIQGEERIQPAFTEAHAFCKEGYAFVYHQLRKKWEVIDVQGNVVNVPFERFNPTSRDQEYPNSDGFVNGLATLNIGATDACINTKMEIVIPNEYSRIAHFRDGYAHAIKEGKDYLLSKDGTVTALQAPLRNVRTPPVQDMVAFYGKNRKWGFMNLKGEVVIEAQFDEVGNFNEDMLAWAKIHVDDVGAINAKGEWVVEAIYDYMADFDPVSKATFVRDKLGKFFILKSSGEVVALPGDVSKTYKFTEGLGLVRLDGNFGLLGFVNPDGQYAIPPKYSGLKLFENGIALAQENGKWGGINLKGETVIPFEFDNIKLSQEGMYQVEVGGKFGFFNPHDNLIIDPVYAEVKPFKDGYAAVLDFRKRKWGMINSAGELVLEPQYTELFFATRIQ